MNNFREEGMFKKKVVDARQLIISKRNKDIASVEPKRMLPPDTLIKPTLNFTIPVKTIDNDIFMKNRVDESNYSIRISNDVSVNSSSSNIRPFINNHRFEEPLAAPVDGGTMSDIPCISPMRILNLMGAKKRDLADSDDGRVLRKRLHTDDFMDIKPNVTSREVPIKPKPPLKTAKFKSTVSPIQGYHVEIKNLHPEVSVDDIYELLTGIGGDLRSCNLVRPGFAEVVFHKLSDAKRSIDEFFGRELDGKPMDVRLTTPAEEPSKLFVDEDVMAKVTNIQSGRPLASLMPVSREAVFRSLYGKGPPKHCKFSVTM